MSILKNIAQRWQYFQGTLFYIGFTPKAYQYSRKRDAIEKQFPRTPTQEPFQNPGKLLEAKPTPRGAHFLFEKAELQITYLTPDFALVNWLPGEPPVPYAIARHQWPEVDTILEETGQSWTIIPATSEETLNTLKINISLDGSLKYYNKAGQLFRQENPPQSKENGWIHTAPLRKEEHIYGLGERAFPLNRRDPKDGRTEVTYKMWNYDAAGMYGAGSDPMYLCIPVYIGIHQEGSYLIFYENSFEANFTLNENAIADFEGGSLRYYITTGTPQHLIERYTELTGRSPLPPRWALGYHQSHWGYRTEEAVKEEAENFKKYNLPLSAIHLDIDVQVGYRAFTIDPDRFPKLPEFIKELLEQDVRFITIMNPGVKYSRESNLFLEGQLLNAFCKLPNGELVTGPVWPGWCVFPDFTNPTVRHWWSRQYEYLLDVGVAGFWHDMNEPAAFILWGDRSLPKPTQHYMEGRGGDHREAHNIYGLMQAKAGYESLRNHRTNLRPFIVSRAGWAGLQRYAWTWTGDIECTWTALKITISTVAGLGLSGIPYSGPDTGGFQGNPPAELYLRWFQLSTFLPFFRTHSSNNVSHRAPWTYGEPYLTIMREFLQLRYRLMPYFYTLAWQASQKGYPLVRPVFWSDPEDPKLWGIDDAFLLGDSLLVCPVFIEGETTRKVTLPKGRWYNFWNDEILESSTEITIDAPLEKIPLFVKEGSIIPMEENKQLTLHIYPPSQSTSESFIYNDSGDGYGETRLDIFRMTQNKDQLEITWQQQGFYPFPYTSIRVEFHGIELQKISIDGTDATPQSKYINCQPFEKLSVIGE